MINIYFWLNTPSIHQAPVIRNISYKNDIFVTVIVENNLSEMRKDMGWHIPDFGNAKVIITPTASHRNEIINTIQPRSINIFSGINSYPETFRTFKKLSKKKDLIIIPMVEPGRHDEGLKSIIRLIKHRFLVKKWGCSIDKILVTGNLGVEWWKSAGFDSEKLIPWGYYVDSYKNKVLDSTNTVSYNNLFEIVVVASLIKRKNHALLIKALSTIDNYYLKIIGHGEERSNLERLCLDFKIDQNVKFIESIANDNVQKEIHNSDLLILPSKYDGWGAVVNEALMVGTPVICSNSCGSSSLITNLNGSVFESENYLDLKAKIELWMSKGKVTSSTRITIKNEAQRSISPEVKSKELLGIIENLLLKLN